MIVKVKIKSNYGSDFIYPVNETARLFTEITKTKTLSKEVINLIKALGYTIEIEEKKFL